MSDDRSSNPQFMGENGPMTAGDCARWLEAKYARHHELEDYACAGLIRWQAEELKRLRTMLAARPADEKSAQDPIGRCCYGGQKPKSACASCAAWQPLETSEQWGGVEKLLEQRNAAIAELEKIKAEKADGVVSVVWCDWGEANNKYCPFAGLIRTTIRGNIARILYCDLPHGHAGPHSHAKLRAAQ